MKTLRQTNNVRDRGISASADGEDAIMSAVAVCNLSLRFVSTRSRVVPIAKHPTLFGIEAYFLDMRGPLSFRQDILKSVLESACKIFFRTENPIPDADRLAIDAALEGGIAVVIFTRMSSVSEWKKYLAREVPNTPLHHEASKLKVEPTSCP